ncbi:hypothetical protein LUZ61_008384 [Rhynchospora tenuis]|uniref:Retrotransposon gag domain-containing protein n=1 Tax=Rhynchospora tenuis TaxID=198213 RepID=A0AAD6EXH2_9POAL|nr:hypothetical protein LUZ61_008384 [Rhynchospora tenuis]
MIDSSDTVADTNLSSFVLGSSNSLLGSSRLADRRRTRSKSQPPIVRRYFFRNLQEDPETAPDLCQTLYSIRRHVTRTEHPSVRLEYQPKSPLLGVARPEQSPSRLERQSESPQSSTARLDPSFTRSERPSTRPEQTPAAMAENNNNVDLAAETERLNALRLQLEREKREFDEERRRWANDDESVGNNSDGENDNNPNKSLMEYGAPRTKHVAGPVVIPGIDANNMQIAPAHVTLVQQSPFCGNEHEDPHSHLQTFIDYTRLIKINGVPQEVIRLLLFRFSLKDKAQKWYKTLKKGSIKTWDAMAQTFLDRYFPTDRADAIRREINNFQQKNDETMRDAWERFRDLENSCPHHGIQEWLIVKSFYNGLYDNIKINLDSLSGGSFLKLDAMRARDVLDECARRYTWYPLANTRRSGHRQQVHEISTKDARIAELEAELAAYQTNQGSYLNSDSCGACGEKGHTSVYCPLAQVNSINNGTYVPKYQYANQNPPSLYRNAQFINNNRDQPFPTKSFHNQEDIPIVVQEFMHKQEKFNQAMAKDMDALKANAGTLQRIERMMLQQYNSKGKLPSQTEVNPNAEVKALHTLRSGTKYKDPPMPEELAKQSVVRSEQPHTRSEHAALRDDEPVLEQILPFPPLQKPTASPGSITETQPLSEPPLEALARSEEAPVRSDQQPDTSPTSTVRSEQAHVRSEQRPGQARIEVENKGKKKLRQPDSTYHPPAPFPERLLKKKEDARFRTFWEILKQLRITIPFTDVVAQVPIYARFLKELCTGKRSLEELKTVALSQVCSDAMKSKMPPKLEDPGRFALPCTIGKAVIKQALCDMGASVSLMPKSVYERIGFEDLMPTLITLKLADSSVRLPLGVLKDVPVQVGKFFIPADFIVMDMEEDVEVPIILGRPFLRTAGVMMDARDGKILVRVGEEQLEFSIDHAMKCPDPDPVFSCFMVQGIEPDIEETLEDQYLSALINYQSFLDDIQESIGVEESIHEVIEGHDEDPDPCSDWTVDCSGRATVQTAAVEEFEPLFDPSDPRSSRMIVYSARANSTNEHSQPLSSSIDPSERRSVREIICSVQAEPPRVKLKPLPASLRYGSLSLSQMNPVIANSKLDAGRMKKLLVEKGAMGYSIDNLKDIDPLTCTHGTPLEGINHKRYDKSFAVSLSELDQV